MLAPPRPFWSVTRKLIRLSTLTSVSVSGLNNLQISWETSHPVLMNMNWKYLSYWSSPLPFPIPIFKVLNYGMSACHRSKKGNQEHSKAIHSFTTSDRTEYWLNGVGWPLTSDLCYNLNVEPPGYKIISEETINCTEWDLLRLWLSGRHNLPSKYEEQDRSDLHPVWSHSAN